MATALAINVVPTYDRADNPTHCCARFNPVPWDGQELRFENKAFVRSTTVSLFHVPLNMGAVFARTWNAIKEAHAEDGGLLVVSRDESPWRAEHLFAVSKPVPGTEMVTLSGDFLTKVFNGPYGEARKWCDEMAREVERRGRTLEKLYFFYTTCPKCAKYYGANYVVGVAKVI